MNDDWADAPDVTYCVRVEFASGGVQYTTIEHAADALDFIDRDKGVTDLFAGLTFRSHTGSYYSIVSDDEAGAR